MAAETLFTIKVPDIGDFKDVDIIEVLVQSGDTVDVETPLITLESDKATMDIPSPVAGTISEVRVAQGGKVSEGDIVATVSVTSEDNSSATDPATSPLEEPTARTKASQPAAPERVSAQGDESEFDLAVLGSGPGGYTAAFRAADLGLRVALVERYPTLGGVCLNVGCIPSKALLHAARVIEETKEMRSHGIDFGEPSLDLEKLQDWKDGVVNQLTGGLAGLAKKRGVAIFQGLGRFSGPNTLDVAQDAVRQSIQFKQAIIAAGSQPVQLPGVPKDPRIVDSTGALALAHIPKRLLVIGGGIIGLEMATVYNALGSAVTIVEMANQLMPGTDADLVRPLTKRLTEQCQAIHTQTRVEEIEPREDALGVRFSGDTAPAESSFDLVLVAVGREANGHRIDAEKAGVHVDERGFISVDHQMRTNQEHIFAIGDIVGQPMLAHKATHEAKVAAEVAAGQKSAFDARVIPSVAYTDPEVAWVGLTETEAKAQNRSYEKGTFPWAASGRALALTRSEGFTKLLFDPKTKQILGGAIVGTNAGDLIGEVALAIEMNCVAADIGLTIHPHPTLAETVGLAAEAFEGTITDLYIPKKR